jgi:hypothetical protein
MSTFNNGLEVNDLVTFSHKIFKKQFSVPRTALVLDRDYLFENKTKYGPKIFFSYKMLDLNSNKVYSIETRNMRVIKVSKSTKEE